MHAHVHCSSYYCTDNYSQQSLAFKCVMTGHYLYIYWFSDIWSKESVFLLSTVDRAVMFKFEPQNFKELYNMCYNIKNINLCGLWGQIVENHLIVVQKHSYCILKQNNVNPPRESMGSSLFSMTHLICYLIVMINHHDRLGPKSLQKLMIFNLMLITTLRISIFINEEVSILLFAKPFGFSFQETYLMSFGEYGGCFAKNHFFNLNLDKKINKNTFLQLFQRFLYHLYPNTLSSSGAPTHRPK